MVHKLLHIIPPLGERHSDISAAVQAMVAGLGRTELDMHVAHTAEPHTPAASRSAHRSATHDGVTYHTFPHPTQPYPVSWPLARWLSYVRGIYDLVHIHAVSTAPALLAAATARYAHVPYIIQPHGTLAAGERAIHPRLKQASLQLLQRPVLRGAARVLFTCEAERLRADDLQISYTAAVIPLGIDLSPFDTPPDCGTFRRQYPVLAGRQVLLFLSRLAPQQGLDLLLAAFAQLRREQMNVALVLAGSGTLDYERHLRHAAQTLNIGPDVVFAGTLTGEQKHAALHESDLFVLPAYYEHFGMPVIEAMASGLPVVISDQVGVAHEVRSAGAGLVVPCEENYLTAMLRRLLAAPEVRTNLGEQGYRVARETFALSHTTDRLVTLYKNVLQRHTRNATHQQH
jgi:glycosyltransferase involved in cell wall biosynthesis